MPESAKEGDSVLPEGSDIGLGPGDRAFEPHYSDQKPSEIANFRGLFLILCLLRRKYRGCHSQHIFSTSADLILYFLPNCSIINFKVIKVTV